jgi:guanylate kinase
MDDTHKQLLDAVRTYKMSAEAVELVSANPPLIISGTTGTGKDVIEQHIQKISSWRHVVTHTTRPLRRGEQNGVDYWFVSEEEMLRLINDQAFIEVKFIHNNQVSGPSIAAYKAALSDGHKPMLRIDIQGIEELHRNVKGLRPFFVLPPTFESWMERLGGRGHMSHVERAKRMHSAQKELEIAIANEHFILVVNDEISRVSKEIIDNITDIPTQSRNRELAKNLVEQARAY